VWFFRDITEHKRIEKALLELSRQDPLTGIANRRSFDERAAIEFSRARRFGHKLSLAMLDIDHFKRINDRWGHAAGDRVLKKLCESVQSELREVDLLARIGGEEFAVLIPDTDLEGAFQLAERLRQGVMAQSLTEGEDLIRFTASFGVAALGPEDRSADEVLKRADVALYEAKAAGRNCTMRENATP
jgi:diguanylate cyclase (GGDEF)-like protein